MVLETWKRLVNNHYDWFELQAQLWPDEELARKRRGYDHETRREVVGMAVALLGIEGAARVGMELGVIDRLAYVMSAGPRAGVICTVPTFAIIRNEEKGILDEEMERRGLGGGFLEEEDQA